LQRAAKRLVWFLVWFRDGCQTASPAYSLSNPDINPFFPQPCKARSYLIANCSAKRPPTGEPMAQKSFQPRPTVGKKWLTMILIFIKIIINDFIDNDYQY